MRISFPHGGPELSLASGSGEALTGALLVKSPLRAVIKEIGLDSLFLQVGQGEIELSLQGLTGEERALLRPGLVLEISRRGPDSVSRQKSPPALEKEGVQVTLTSHLGEALSDLNIKPDSAALRAAAALLESGLPLRRELVLILLPWAEQGRLKEALQLWQGGFPLNSELLQALQKREADGLPKPLLEGALPLLSPELQELLKRPQWGARSRLGPKLAQGAVLQSLASLFLRERITEFFLNHENGGAQFVFALPFLLGGDLQACWVRFRPKKERTLSSAGEKKQFTVEFLLPTETWGRVGGKLQVWGRSVSVVFYTEGEGSRSVLEKAGVSLQKELEEAGWRLTRWEAVTGSETFPEGWVP